MQDDEKPSAEYERNFNVGYTLRANYDQLSKEEREVVDHMLMLNSDSPAVNAFRDGVKEYLFEKNVSPKLSRTDRKPSKSKDRDKDRGKDLDR